MYSATPTTRTLSSYTTSPRHTRGRLDAHLKRLGRELTNLAETAAHGGAVPAILDALAQRDAERRQLLADVAAVKPAAGPPLQPAAVRARLRGVLDGWHELLTANATEARGVLDGVLGDRIQFTPDEQRRRYRLTMPIAFDRVLSCVLPDLALTRNDGVPNGIQYLPVIPLSRLFRAA